ncbi:phosphoadenosine phosphosulfate reductase family protein [Streptomyces sp. NBC_01142]|uniref:phosphoadenosine phosphosulfate reductase family protein n=1 Tax=Streptomyces sp. NBC_01142 TaxID=2975865 RepID=UPI00225035E8|nr:phosphoadenosine phosphosulfate reductase family protein [Streptomyces sp. NBC_01142]MCX4826548.1 phosphoadenosine phosphosulfate reductase family protein [Streptomyces sp. NBC_01142]
MHLSTRLHLLDLIRISASAESACRAADRAARKASIRRKEAAATRRQRRLALRSAPSGGAVDALADAERVYRERAADVDAAGARWRRAFTASARADARLGGELASARVLTGSDRPRAKGGRTKAETALLAELAAMPATLIEAAHAILVQSSAGKDSVVALDRVVRWAKAAGCLDKVVVVHADIGEEAEWPGVRDLAQQQAERYGLRFVVVKASVGFLGMVEKRGLWPDAQNRLCTSTLKRDEAAKLFTQIVDELGLDDQALIVNCLGIRAAESPSRRKKHELAIDHRASNGRRLVLTWHPVFHLSETDIWQEIADQTLDYHPVYDTLIPRLSCIFCILASFEVLVRAVRLCWVLGLPTPKTYVDLEQRIGHRFKNQFSLAQVVEEASRREAAEGPLIWRRGDAIRHHLGEDAAAAYLHRLALAA